MGRELLTKAKEVALTWWIVGAWFVLFTMVSFGTSIVTVFYGMRWMEMDWQDRIMAMILILVNWGTVMMAFLNKAATRVQKGDFPIAEGDENVLTHRKTVVATSQTVVSSPP